MKELFRLRQIVRPYWPQVAGALIALVLINAASLAVPSVIQSVIDDGLAQGNLGYMLTAALIILGIGLGRGAFGLVYRYLSLYAGTRVAYDLRNRLYSHIQRLPFTYHDHAQTGQLMSRCTEDVSAIQNFISDGIFDLLQIDLLMAGALSLMFSQSPTLAVIALIPLIPMLVITARFGGKVSQLFYTIDKSLGDLSSKLQENVSGAQVVRAFAREEYEIERFDASNRELYHAHVNTYHAWSKVMPTTVLLVSFSTLLILWFGGRMAIAGELSVGQVVAFNSYLLLLAAPTQQLTWLVNGAGEAAAGIRRVFEVLDHVPEIRDAENATPLADISGKVEFVNVDFQYAGETERALHSINLSVQPNQIIALIGPTGSGKTSLVNLIPRFYDVLAGEVRIDGHDVRTLELDALRRQIGIVLQTSLLFSATIRENIAFGRPFASEDEIVTAAKAAQAHDFILATPNGYETVVGERGITLSGGQRQRVAIARALLINPRVLILDDSTSSVDTETEHFIQKALATLMEGRTTFVIAQRLSTVRNADLILVMDKGRIAQRGTHAELLREGGLYREIYDLQLSPQEEFAEETEQLQASGND